MQGEATDTEPRARRPITEGETAELQELTATFTGVRDTFRLVDLSGLLIRLHAFTTRAKADGFITCGGKHYEMHELPERDMPATTDRLLKEIEAISTCVKALAEAKANCACSRCVHNREEWKPPIDVPLTGVKPSKAAT